MSGFINGSVGLPVTIHAAQDYRACDSLYFGKRSRAPDRTLVATEMRVADNAHDGFTYQTRWWPRAGGLLGGWGDGLDGDTFLNKSARWKAPRVERGCNSRFAIVGYTRDATGTPIAGATVRMYRTSSDEMVSKVTSDANGLYYSTSPYNDGHFQVVHNSAGDRAGATANTLLPS